jgi:hypothetical protein
MFFQISPSCCQKLALSRGILKPALTTLANSATVATWYTDNDPNAYMTVQKLLNKCGSDTVPVIVVYGLPRKDCDAGFSNLGSNKDAEMYEKWVRDLSDLLDNRPVVYVLEPDAVGLHITKDCAKTNGYIDNMMVAASILSTNTNASVYVDVGYWTLNDEANVTRVSQELKQINTKGKLKGVALNTANYRSNKEMVDACSNVLTETAKFKLRFKCVIDTSRNYKGVTKGNEWCNSRYAALGTPSTNDTKNDDIDFFLWLKTPGESDGPCTNATLAAHLESPPAGTFFEKAFSLMWDRGYFVATGKGEKLGTYADDIDDDEGTMGGTSIVALVIVLGVCAALVGGGFYMKRRYDAKQSRLHFLGGGSSCHHEDEMPAVESQMSKHKGRPTYNVAS